MRFSFGVFVFAMTSISACGRGSGSAPAGTGATIAASSADLWQAMSRDPNAFRKGLAQAGAVSFSQIINQASAGARDLPAQVDGMAFANLAASLKAHAGEGAAMDARFHRLANLWQALGADPSAASAADLAAATKSAVDLIAGRLPEAVRRTRGFGLLDPFSCEASGYQKAMLQCAQLLGGSMAKMTVDYYAKGVQSANDRLLMQLGANCVSTLNKFCPNVVPDGVKPMPGQAVEAKAE